MGGTVMRFIPTLSLAIVLTAASLYGTAASAAAPAEKTEVIEIEKMTWPELKAAMAAGKTTALFYTGGTEQRGPQNIIAGHNGIGRETVRDIALKLGNAIAMPAMPFSPTGIDPETPGDINLPAETLGIVLENISESAIANGFKNVVLMGDSGGGQETRRQVCSTGYPRLLRRLPLFRGARGLQQDYRGERPACGHARRHPGYI
jgi:creatinine amidohydrolase